MRLRITLDDALVRDLDSRVGPRRRGEFIAAAIRRALDDEHRWSYIEGAIGRLAEIKHDRDASPGSWVRAQREVDRTRIGWSVGGLGRSWPGRKHRQSVQVGRHRLQAAARLPILARVQTMLGILATVTLAVGLPALWIAARRKGKTQQSQPSRLSSAMARYLGPAPGKDAPEVQRLRRIREVGLKIALPFVPIVIIAVITIDQVWAYALFAAWALLWLGSNGRALARHPTIAVTRSISRRRGRLAAVCNAR